MAYDARRFHFFGNVASHEDDGICVLRRFRPIAANPCMNIDVE